MSEPGSDGRLPLRAQPVEPTGPRDPSDARKDKVELWGAILIGLAAVLTALATYQGSQFDGTVTEKNAEALRLTLFANDKYNDATAQQAIERDWFFTYITELENGTAAADYFALAMPDEVFELADEFSGNEDDGILDPFSPEAADSYEAYANLPSVTLLDEGLDYDRRAACASFESEVAGTQGDDLGLSTVFLAIALVVGGIAALLRRRAAQTIALTVSVLSLILGAGLLLVAGDADEARAAAAQEFFLDEDGEQQPTDVALAEADDTCPAGPGTTAD